MMRKMPSDPEMYALAKQGLSASAIARQVGISRQAVHQWSKRNGVTLAGCRTGRPPIVPGRLCCLKLQVPRAVKKWARQNLERVQNLVLNAWKNPDAIPGDIWEDVYSQTLDFNAN